MRKILFPTVVFILLFTACSKYQKVLKGTDHDAKFELAIKLYEKKNYYKALPLFEELTTIYRGQKKAEKVAYYYAYCNFKAGDYETAAFDFDNFARTYPQSEYTEECAFMVAYCYYKGSPNSSLDQTFTIRAINQLQLFVDNYPATSRITECNNLIDELRAKLEVKDYENAYLYLKMEEYKASVSAFKTFLKEYPSTQYRERALFFIVKAQYLLSENGVEIKKEERYNAAITYYENFITAYPNSTFAKEAKNIYEVCKQKSNMFASQNK